MHQHIVAFSNAHCVQVTQNCWAWNLPLSTTQFNVPHVLYTTKYVYGTLQTHHTPQPTMDKIRDITTDKRQQILYKQQHYCTNMAVAVAWLPSPIDNYWTLYQISNSLALFLFTSSFTFAILLRAVSFWLQINTFLLNILYLTTNYFYCYHITLLLNLNTSIWTYKKSLYYINCIQIKKLANHHVRVIHQHIEEAGWLYQWQTTMTDWCDACIHANSCNQVCTSLTDDYSFHTTYMKLCNNFTCSTN